MPEAVKSAPSDSHIREPLSESELRTRAQTSNISITPDDVLRLTNVTNGESILANSLTIH